MYPMKSNVDVVADKQEEEIVVVTPPSNISSTSDSKQRKMKESRSVSRIGFAYNAKSPDMNGENTDSNLEFDEIETIEAIQKGIESQGFEVIPLEANGNFIEKLKSSDVDFVFNIAEGINGESRESHIPAILEMYGIPYSGSGVLTQAITLNKSTTSEILKSNGIRTPPFQLFRTPHEKLKKGLKFPLMVKPNCEGSSIGITNESLVFDEKQLKKQVRRVIQNHSQAALVESFCNGREFTVGMIGNKKIKILPIVEVKFDHLPPAMAKIDSYESKWVYDTPELNVNPLICPARITKLLQKNLESIARRTFKALDCADFCRIDIRLNSKGIPMVIDVNTLPGLNPDPIIHSRFPLACRVAGISFKEIIEQILITAFERLNLRKG